MPTTKKRAVFWQGKKPTRFAPKGFITNCPQKNIDAAKSFSQFMADKIRAFTSK